MLGHADPEAALINAGAGETIEDVLISYARASQGLICRRWTRREARPALDALIPQAFGVGVANGQRVPKTGTACRRMRWCTAHCARPPAPLRIDANDMNSLRRAKRATPVATRCIPITTRYQEHDGPSSASALDQAHGLRRLFAHARCAFVPVLSNRTGLRRRDARALCRDFGRTRQNTLVIDASNVRGASEMA